MRLLAAVIATLLATGSFADEAMFRLEPSASTIQFQLRAMGFIPVRGTAQAQGAVAVTEGHADIDVSVALSALKMSRDSYREWALSAEFFDATKHPELRFYAAAVPLQRLQQGGAIDGELRVRGITRPVRFTLVGGGCDLSKAACAVRANGELSRRAFGMKSRRYTLGDRIGVTLELQLVSQP